MSYQVLARKWRPQTFQQMVGQAHVLRALQNALSGDASHQRLHHAYLFTGTRGVGKTTVARIFAKCLNCESGVTPEPCGVCRHCREIAEGRHVDLLEVDAASRTKVEDTRELLENVQYAPTRGRFKIYLVDEVHMLSGHSFNALLKTLEEPPPHVKFLFATTDPQKLPVTILSRCLQFNLKRMPADLIMQHLSHVLTQEGIPYSEAALRLLARAADGSMRDALSLTDQAIVGGGGAVDEAVAQDMLGLLPQGHLADLLYAIVGDEGQRALAIVAQMAQLTTDFAHAADSLISLLHQIAVQQVVPDAAADADIANLAKLLAPADVQLYYQMALHGRRDLPLAPDPRSGFEMLVLRLLAFRLEDGKKKILKADPTTRVAPPPVPAVAPPIAPSPPPVSAPAAPLLPTDWHTLLPQLGLSGAALSLAQHCLLESAEGGQVTLLLDAEAEVLLNASSHAALQAALEKHWGRPVKLNFKAGTVAGETPQQRLQREAAAQQQAAEQAIHQDPLVQALQAQFGAAIVAGSVRPHNGAAKM